MYVGLIIIKRARALSCVIWITFAIYIWKFFFIIVTSLSVIISTKHKSDNGKDGCNDINQRYDRIFNNFPGYLKKISEKYFHLLSLSIEANYV